MTEAPYVTVSEAAELLSMTPDGVRKRIRSGRLVAVRRSERKTMVSRLSIAAYQDRLNGTPIPAPAQPPAMPLATRLNSFEARHGVPPQGWLEGWRAQEREDSAETMRSAIEALSLELERQDAAEPAQAQGAVVAR